MIRAVPTGSGLAGAGSLAEGTSVGFRMRFQGVAEAAKRIHLQGSAWASRQRAARARVAWLKLQAGRITDPRSVAALHRDYAAEFAQFAKEGVPA